MRHIKTSMGDIFPKRIIRNLYVSSVHFFQWLHEQIFWLKNCLRIFNDTSKFEAMSFYMAVTLYAFVFGFSHIFNRFSLHFSPFRFFSHRFGANELMIQSPKQNRMLKYFSKFMCFKDNALCAT